ncbi:hypothetical protein AB0D59_11085 [Streptomyces sp. NPDC048417]|uniref:hypothetical protein n=1 Tax=Streptomyces sp. NPDC048417 TaxID=3155387 RepID=UPI0034135339
MPGLVAEDTVLLRRRARFAVPALVDGRTGLVAPRADGSCTSRGAPPSAAGWRPAR